MSCETLSGLIFARIMFCGFGEFFFVFFNNPREISQYFSYAKFDLQDISLK